MSKNILGQTFGTIDLNLDLVGDINATNLTASTSITGSYLTANKGLATDANKKIVSTTASSDEINFLTGTTSAIQTQLNNKLLGDGIAPAFQYAAEVGGSQNILTMNFQAPANDDITHTSSAKQIKDALDTKQPIVSLTANRALVSNGSGGLAVSDITNTELSRLDGVSGNIQSQLTTNANAITSSNSAIATNASAIATNASAITTANSAIATNASAITTANSAIATNASAITSANSAIATNASAITSANSAIATNATAIAGKQATIGNSLSTSNTFTLVVGSLSPKTYTFNATGDFVGAGSITDATGNVLSGKQNIFSAGSNLSFDASSTPPTLNASNPWTINGNIISYTAGQVGIGDAGASDKALTVRRNGLTQTLQYWVSNLGTAGDRPLLLRSPDSNSVNSPFEFQTGNALSFVIDSIDALCINSSANVGIGTASPPALLSVDFRFLMFTNGNPDSAKIGSSNKISIGDYRNGISNNTTENFVIQGGDNASQALIFTTGGSYQQQIRNIQGWDTLASRDFARPISLQALGGNVGINTTAPDNTLTLDGVFQLNPQSGTAKFAMYSDNDKFEINKRSSSGGFEANMFVMNTSGNVGIGTTNPNELLHINGNAELRNTTANGNVYINMIEGTSLNGIRQLYDGTNNSYKIQSADSGSLTTRFTFTRSGNVGIGTDTPTSMLHLKSTGDVGIRLEADSDNVDEEHLPSIHMSQDDNRFFQIIQGINSSEGHSNDNSLYFEAGSTNGSNTSSIVFNLGGTSGPYSGTEKLRIDNNGNVGIGTTAPSDKLHVNNGSISLGDWLDSGSHIVGLGNPNGNSLTSSQGTSGGMEIESVNAGTGNYSQVLHFHTHWFGNSIGRRMTIRYDGNVGINEGSPTQKLHVGGVCRATSFTTSSDDRVKHFEKPTTDCLNKIMTLKPTTYQKSNELYDIDFVLADDKSNLKEGDELHLEVGFIAQQVKESIYEEFSSSVKGGDFMGYPVVNEPVVEELVENTEDPNVEEPVVEEETVVEEESEEEEPVVEEPEKVLIEQEYTLNYNNIFVVAVGAIQELKLEIDTLKERIALLESK